VTKKTFLDNAQLIHWHLERREGVSPAINRRCIIDTLKRRAIVARLKRSGRPLAKQLCLTLIRPSLRRSVQSRRLHPILHPINHNIHVVRRVRPIWLQRVGATVYNSRDEVELIPRLQCFQGSVCSVVRVRDRADGLPIMDRRGGRNTWVRFTVVMDHLTTGRLEGCEIRKGGSQTVQVTDEADIHPINQGIVSDVVKVGEVVDIQQLDEFGDMFTTYGWDIEFPGSSVRVVCRLGIVKLGSNLPGEVGSFASRVVKTVVDGLRDGDSFCSDRSVLLWLRTCRAAFCLSLAESETKRG
jgi:hypothetical protein